MTKTRSTSAPAPTDAGGLQISVVPRAAVPPPDNGDEPSADLEALAERVDELRDAVDERRDAVAAVEAELRAAEERRALAETVTAAEPLGRECDVLKSRRDDALIDLRLAEADLSAADQAFQVRKAELVQQQLADAVQDVIDATAALSGLLKGPLPETMRAAVTAYHRLGVLAQECGHPLADQLQHPDVEALANGQPGHFELGFAVVGAAAAVLPAVVDRRVLATPASLDRLAVRVARLARKGGSES